MARLRRANDGHLYIRASQSQGTWQVSEEGEFWLRLQGYSIPEQGEVVDISGGEFAYLKDHKYIYIHGFDYDHNRQAIPPDDQREPELVVSGLLLFLHLNEQEGLIWELALDLAKLNDDAWNELDRYHATFVTVTGAWTSVSQQQLSNTPCLLRIDPKSEPYQLYWENNEHTRQAMELSSPTPGLDRGWKGNVFVESDQRGGIWRRCLPRSAISFNGKLLWLASSECKPEWPGKATPIGKEYLNWQLWRLEVDEHAPALWEEVWRWLHYRSIDLVEQRQRLKVVSPPMAVMDDGEYVTPPGKPLLIECNPPHRLVRGISKQIVLIAEQMDRAAQYTGRPSQVISAPLLSDQVNYFSWSPPYGGNYRIKIEG